MQNIDNYREIITWAGDYFGFSEKQTIKFLHDKFPVPSTSYSRLYYILKALKPSLNLFVDKASKELKKKIGNVIFNRLNYDSFHEKESCYETYDRLSKLFCKTTAKGINPYEIIYINVLTNGELFLDKDGEYNRGRENFYNFDKVFDALERTLSLESHAVVKMYERCSTLLSRVSSSDVKSVYETISALNFFWIGKRIYIFDHSIEVKDLLRNKPFLFSLKSENIQEAFEYICSRVKAMKKLNPNSSEVDVMAVKDTLCDWINNNATLLSMNKDDIKFKQRAIANQLYDMLSDRYLEVCQELFWDPTNIAYISNIAINDFKKNYKQNLMALKQLDDRAFLSDDELVSYLKKSKLIYGIPNNQLISVIDAILNSDQSEELKTKFLQSGDAIFPYFAKYTTAEILAKLSDNQILMPIKLYNMTKKEIARTFFEIFDYTENVDKSFNNFMNFIHHIREINDGNKMLAPYLDEALEDIEQISAIVKSKKSILKYKGDCDKICALTNKLERCIYNYIQEQESYLFDIKEKRPYFENEVRLQQAGQQWLDYIDFIYHNNIDNARKIYKNADELYEVFRKNSEEKFKLEQGGKSKFVEVARKFGEEVATELSDERQKFHYQFNFLDFVKHETAVDRYYKDIVITTKSENGKFNKNAKNVKMALTSVANLLSSQTGDVKITITK